MGERESGRWERGLKASVMSTSIESPIERGHSTLKIPDTAVSQMPRRTPAEPGQPRLQLPEVKTRCQRRSGGVQKRSE